ncbi:MAG: thymidine phosphorylase [Clostridia bacterium]
MNFCDIIENKKRGLELSAEEINFFVDSVVTKTVPDYQISALLMAITIKGMSDNETFLLTKAMAESGEMLDLSMYESTVDKHSTGGVGDSTTFVVLPIVACFGVNALKMSGRGLGFTGGTLDKLEGIPNFNIVESGEALQKQIDNVGIAIIGQSQNISPCDKILYALRDVTATIDSIPLIASSIMSKKLAGGSKNIVLDVKVGKGAFMKDLKSAEILAKLMVSIGKAYNKNIKAILTNMDSPLGNYIGNSLEVYGAIRVLEGAQNRLLEVSLVLAETLLKMCNIDVDRAKLLEVINSKQALNKFKNLVSAQGGDVSYIENPEKLIYTNFKFDVFAEHGGYIRGIDAIKISKIVLELGGGRKTKDDKIDLAVGVELHKTVGDFVAENEKIATMYYNNDSDILLCQQLFASFDIGEATEEKLIYKTIE